MGYLIIDHKSYDGTVQEWDTENCMHCQKVLPKLKPGQPSGAFCTRCMGQVCNTDACATSCIPWQKKIDDALKGR